MGGRKQLGALESEKLDLAHSIRFRTFGMLYPRTVAFAYQGDIFRAMRSPDKQVARRVIAWAKREGLPASNYIHALAIRIASGKAK